MKPHSIDITINGMDCRAAADAGGGVRIVHQGIEIAYGQNLELAAEDAERVLNKLDARPAAEASR